MNWEGTHIEMGGACVPSFILRREEGSALEKQKLSFSYAYTRRWLKPYAPLLDSQDRRIRS